MIEHGDSIISGATTERQDKRPSCAWPVKTRNSLGSEVEKACGSEERIFNVQGKGRYTGRERQTPVCGKHLQDAWKAWNVDSAQPL